MSRSIEQMQADLRQAHNSGNTDLARRINAKIQETKAAEGPPAEEEGVNWNKFAPVNIYNRIVQGASDLVQDPGLTAMKAFGSEEEQQQAIEFEDKREARMARINEAAGNEGIDGWRLASNMMSGGAGPTLQTGKNLLQRAGNLATTGGVMGAGAPAGPTGEEAAAMSPEEIRMQTGKDVGTNASIGALTSVILPEALRLGLNAGTGTVRFIQDLVSAADKEGSNAVKYAKDHLLELMPDDVSRNKISKTIGQYIDMVDPRSTRQKQINKARKHVEEIQQSHTQGPEDPMTVIGRSMDDRDKVLRARDKANYENVYELTDVGPAGNPNYIEDEGIRRTAEHMFYELQSGIPELQGRNLQNVAASLADTDPKTFSQWDNIRSDLFNQAEVAKAAGDHKTAGILESLGGQIFGQLDRVAEDMGGEVAQRWRKARTFHRDSVLPNRQAVIGKAVRQNDAEEFVNELISPGVKRDRKNRAHQLWNALDDEGRLAARQALMDEVVRAGTDKAQDTGFSPAKAATALEDMTERSRAFFNEDDAAQMTGLANYLRFISRSTLAAGTSGTGMSLGAGVLGGLGYQLGTSEEGFPTGAIGSGMGIYFLMRSPRGRSILQKMATAEPGERAFQNLARDLDDVFAKIGREAGVVAPRVMGSGGGW